MLVFWLQKDENAWQVLKRSKEKVFSSRVKIVLLMELSRLW